MSSRVDPWKNKTAIVTGAGQGIGFEIARQLLMREVRVVLNDSDEDLLHKAAEKLYAGESGSSAVENGLHAAESPAQTGENCLPLAGDAADVGFVREMVDTAVRKFGRIDMVVANAGLTVFGDFFDYTPESFNRVMQLNLSGSFFLAQAAAREMRRQGEGGSILFMSSVTAHQAHRHLTAYGMSKAALEMLARNLVIDLSPYRITVNTVAPGATITERTAGDAAYEKTWSALTPMGRPANVQDIARAVVFLIGPEARHITGQTLIIDGGWTAVSPGPQ